MRVKCTYSGVQMPTNRVSFNYLILQIIPEKLSRGATPIDFGSPHEAICAGFVDTYLPILHF
jgi:hypothetical protein